MNTINRFENKNLLLIKDVAKKTAAMTLLLSTVACGSNNTNDGGLGTFILGLSCCFVASFIPLGLMILRMPKEDPSAPAPSAEINPTSGPSAHN